MTGAVPPPGPSPSPTPGVPAVDPWRVWLPIALVGIVVAAVVLVWWGSDAILSSTGGNLVRTVDDPAQPGFEALVEPTPVMAVIGVDVAGGLGSVSLLALAGPGEGAVIVASPATLVSADGAEQRTLGAAWGDGGAPAVRDGLASVLNVGVGEDRVIDPQQWAALLEPVAPLVVDNPAAFESRAADGQTIRFPAGTVELNGENADAYLGGEVSGDQIDVGLERLERFWTAWIEAVGEGIAVPGVIPGEAETGLGRFVRVLATSSVALARVPVAEASLPGVGDVLQPIPADVSRLVAQLVPFPLGASPDSRLRVRVLDGTGQLDNGLPATPALVEASAEVATVGNATRFDYAVTQFIVAPGVDPARVEVLQRSLGVGEVVASAELASAVELTIVLGADAVATLGGPYPPPTLPDGAAGGRGD